ncbi:MAG TPA: ATP-grasp domain-containing protein, partial [Pirellulaceae bacterium]
MSSGTIQPGGTIGVLGSGQLGRMFAIAARQMGYRVHVLSPAADTPTGQVADVEILADYEALDRVAEFARQVDVVTFEFENVPAETAATALRYAPVRPSGSILHTTQHRLREKEFLQRHGFPVTPFREVRSRDQLRSALIELGCPAVLKSAAWGYDGKGQCRIHDASDVLGAWTKVNADQAVLEAHVDFACEVSVMAARGLDGSVVIYDPIANTHARHILDVSVSPAGIPPALATQAKDLARNILEALDYVGVLGVEFFLAGDG